MGSDVTTYLESSPCIISIHAPAWGATGTEGNTDTDNHISIHAPAWGATYGIWYGWCGYCYFNPRSRMGSDNTPFYLKALNGIFQSTLPHGERRTLETRVWRNHAISIHAPAWGATIMLKQLGLELLTFQSTLPHGERHGSSW